jgi:hypothetical protein
MGISLAVNARTSCATRVRSSTPGKEPIYERQNPARIRDNSVTPGPYHLLSGATDRKGAAISRGRNARRRAPKNAEMAADAVSARIIEAIETRIHLAMPTLALVIVASRSDLVTGGSEDPEDRTDYDEQHADGPQDGNAGEHADEK